jgi:hypothetical protein
LWTKQQIDAEHLLQNTCIIKIGINICGTPLSPELSTLFSHKLPAAGSFKAKVAGMK